MKVAMKRLTGINLQYPPTSSALLYFTVLIITAACLIGGYTRILCSIWNPPYPSAGGPEVETTHNRRPKTYHDGSSTASSRRHDLDKCPGYHVTSIDDRLPGRLSMDLFLHKSPCDVYGKDVQHLKLEVTYESSMPPNRQSLVYHNRIRVLITSSRINGSP